MKLFLFLLTFFWQVSAFANSFSNDTTFFRITSYNIDGKEFDELALEENAQLLLFTDSEGNPFFENHFKNKKEYSSGKIYDFKYENFPESDSTYAIQDINFIWRYFNSYDSEKGSASVNIQMIYTENLTKFTCIIIGIDKRFELILSGYRL